MRRQVAKDVVRNLRPPTCRNTLVALQAASVVEVSKPRMT